MPTDPPPNGVQVRDTRRRSFTLDYMFKGRAAVTCTSPIFPTGRRVQGAGRRHMYIADFPDWSTNASGEHTRSPYSICCDA
jgi:hypothetical protein